MATVRIRVTQRDMDKGTRLNPERHPVTRAIRRATRMSVTVSYTCVFWHTIGITILPPFVTQWMEAYDAGCDWVMPLEFDMNWPILAS